MSSAKNNRRMQLVVSWWVRKHSHKECPEDLVNLVAEFCKAIFFDPKDVHPHLSLSEDRRIVTCPSRKFHVVLLTPILSTEEGKKTKHAYQMEFIYRPVVVKGAVTTYGNFGLVFLGEDFHKGKDNTYKEGKTWFYSKLDAQRCTTSQIVYSNGWTFPWARRGKQFKKATSVNKYDKILYNQTEGDKLKICTLTISCQNLKWKIKNNKGEEMDGFIPPNIQFRIGFDLNGHSIEVLNENWT